jgi:hypothetical protein
VTYTPPPCESDPDRWFTERDGRRYDDEVLVTEEELRAALPSAFGAEPDLETAEEKLEELTAAKVKERLVERRHARDDCHVKCKVRTLCLQKALDNREAYGIWGGYFPEQRRELEREIDRREQRRRERLGIED